MVVGWTRRRSLGSSTRSLLLSGGAEIVWWLAERNYDFLICNLM